MDHYSHISSIADYALNQTHNNADHIKTVSNMAYTNAQILDKHEQEIEELKKKIEYLMLQLNNDNG